MPCVVCKKPVPPRFKYCPRHRRFGTLAADNQSIAEICKAMIASWDEKADAHRCKYCGRLLNETDHARNDYATFDHWIPVESPLVMCCRRCNSMKNALTGPEFLKIIPALDDWRAKGIPFPRDVVAFDCWDWKRLQLSAPFPPRKVAPFEARIRKFTDCIVCEGVLYPKSRYCARCRKFITEQRDNAEKAQAMIESWDKNRKGFACQITDQLIEENEWHSPWYGNFDHIDPKKPKRQFVCACANRMKGNMTRSKFRKVVSALANHIRTGASVDC